MYRQPIPDFSQVDFELLSGVAEAAEKYQIYTAMEVCKLHMRLVKLIQKGPTFDRRGCRDHVLKHPFEVLVYTHQHGYDLLMDIAAPQAIGKEKLEKAGQDFCAVWVRRPANLQS
jgi:hypothetical protein